MLRIIGRIVVGLLAAVGLAATIGAWMLLRDGTGSRGEPGRLETAVARRLRSIAIPADAKRLENPVAPGAEAVADGLAHFADHCAMCHANDGSGKTEIGRGLYPKPPDLRLAPTQNLTDGELFYIIENGVKLTGMPAWGHGASGDDASSWKLVHFVRRLPKITREEIERMEALNPRGPDEWRQAVEEGRIPDAKKKGTFGHTHKH